MHPRPSGPNRLLKNIPQQLNETFFSLACELFSRIDQSKSDQNLKSRSHIECNKTRNPKQNKF